MSDIERLAEKVNDSIYNLSLALEEANTLTEDEHTLCSAIVPHLLEGFVSVDDHWERATEEVLEQVNKERALIEENERLRQELEALRKQRSTSTKEHQLFTGRGTRFI